MANSKKLYRSKKQRILGGVCGGMGEYFDIDPSLIRLIWLLIFLMGGSGLLIYIIFWIIVPEEEENRKEVKDGKKN